MEEEKNTQSGIQPSPFENLTETDLMFLLEHDKDKLTEQQIADIHTKLDSFEKESEPNITQDKTMTLVPRNSRRAGYVDVVILMLTTWITCLVGLAYIYLNLGVLG